MRSDSQYGENNVQSFLNLYGGYIFVKSVRSKLCEEYLCVYVKWIQGLGSENSKLVPHLYGCLVDV